MGRTGRIGLVILAAGVCFASSATVAPAQSPLTMVTYNAHWGEEIDARTGH